MRPVRAPDAGAPAAPRPSVDPQALRFAAWVGGLAAAPDRPGGRAAGGPAAGAGGPAVEPATAEAGRPRDRRGALDEAGLAEVSAGAEPPSGVDRRTHAAASPASHAPPAPAPGAVDAARAVVARFASRCLASMAVGGGRARLRLGGGAAAGLVVDLELRGDGVDARLAGHGAGVTRFAAALDAELARRGFDRRRLTLEER